MYLVLYPNNNGVSSFREDDKPVTSYNPFYTTDIYKVSEALKRDDVIVYKIDSLTRVRAIEMTYQEIVMEMDNE